MSQYLEHISLGSYSTNLLLGTLKLAAEMVPSDVFKQPFHPPPPGVLLDYSHPQTQGRVMTITSSVFLGIMIVFVSIRAYTKLLIVRKITWDDRMSTYAFKSNRINSKLKSATVTCLIGFVRLTLNYL